jgi:hypothetical protein
MILMRSFVQFTLSDGEMRAGDGRDSGLARRGLKKMSSDSRTPRRRVRIQLGAQVEPKRMGSSVVVLSRAASPVPSTMPDRPQTSRRLAASSIAIQDGLPLSRTETFMCMCCDQSAREQKIAGSKHHRKLTRVTRLLPQIIRPGCLVAPQRATTNSMGFVDVLSAALLRQLPPRA